MTGIEIKKLLKDNKVKMVDIASDLGVSHSSVSLVIHGKSTSAKISREVADRIGLPLTEVFPNIGG